MCHVHIPSTVKTENEGGGEKGKMNAKILSTQTKYEYGPRRAERQFLFGTLGIAHGEKTRNYCWPKKVAEFRQ